MLFQGENSICFYHINFPLESLPSHFLTAVANDHFRNTSNAQMFEPNGALERGDFKPVKTCLTCSNWLKIARETDRPKILNFHFPGLRNI